MWKTDRADLFGDLSGPDSSPLKTQTPSFSFRSIGFLMIFFISLSLSTSTLKVQNRTSRFLFLPVSNSFLLSQFLIYRVVQFLLRETRKGEMTLSVSFSSRLRA